jgi:GR25 family glycosyltransferase involved in LPS biosynthesis
MTEENIPKAVVLEDDAQFDINFSSILVLLEKIKINNYIIKLDRCTSKQTGNDNRLFTRSTPWHRIKLNDHYIIKQPLNDPKLTTGYYIDIKAAQAMLLTMPKIFMAADNWKYFRFFIKLRFLNTAVVWSNIKFKSIIDPGRYREKADKSKNNTFVFTRPFKKFFLLCRLLFH